ncbi:MAG: tetratricopeptide repeat protein, partial [Pseudomonadota bacterium]
SPDHPDISRLLGEMARAWTHLDEPARAALLFEEAIGHFDARGDGGSRGAMILRFNYSNALENLGRVREAERVLLALQDLMRVHAPDDPNLCKVMNNIGDNRRVQGRFEDAEAILMDAVACKQRAYGADAQTTGNSTLLLADAMLAQGLTEGVAVLVDDGLRIRTAQFGEDSPRLAYPLELRGELRSQRGDHGGAVADLEHVIELRAGNGEDATLHYAQTWERLGWAQARAGRPEASRVAFDRAFAAIRAGDVMSHPAALRLRVARLESHARAGQPLPEAPSELLATVLAEAPYRADLAATLAGFQR